MRAPLGAWFGGGVRSAQWQEVIMSESEDVRARLRRMRGQAEDLEKAAEQASDPSERRRLQDEAHRLESQSVQVSGMASGDIYPME